MNFISVADFKNITGCSDIRFIKNDESGKLFVGVGNKTYKCQQSITNSEPIRFMYSDDEGFDAGCFTNVKPATINTAFTL